MAINEHLVTYQHTNTYETLNELTENTKNVWFVFHGMGFLSRYFLKCFKGLDPRENYIIAPQAPSKYYLKDDFKHVGASWLTKEATELEIENILRYLDSVKKAENIGNDKRILLFGFSQGVSVVLRWFVRRNVSCSLLVLYAGGIPNEIKKGDLKSVSANVTQVKVIYGDNDVFLTKERLQEEKLKIESLFGKKAEIINFKGGHELRPDIIGHIANTLA